MADIDVDSSYEAGAQLDDAKRGFKRMMAQHSRNPNTAQQLTRARLRKISRDARKEVTKSKVQVLASQNVTLIGTDGIVARPEETAEELSEREIRLKEALAAYREQLTYKNRRNVLTDQDLEEITEHVNDDEIVSRDASPTFGAQAEPSTAEVKSSSSSATSTPQRQQSNRPIPATTSTATASTSSSAVAPSLALKWGKQAPEGQSKTLSGNGVSTSASQKSSSSALRKGTSTTSIPVEKSPSTSSLKRGQSSSSLNNSKAAEPVSSATKAAAKATNKTSSISNTPNAIPVTQPANSSPRAQEFGGATPATTATGVKAIEISDGPKSVVPPAEVNPSNARAPDHELSLDHLSRMPVTMIPRSRAKPNSPPDDDTVGDDNETPVNAVQLKQRAEAKESGSDPLNWRERYKKEAQDTLKDIAAFLGDESLDSGTEDERDADARSPNRIPSIAEGNETEDEERELVVNRSTMRSFSTLDEAAAAGHIKMSDAATSPLPAPQKKPASGAVANGASPPLLLPVAGVADGAGSGIGTVASVQLVEIKTQEPFPPSRTSTASTIATVASATSAEPTSAAITARTASGVRFLPARPWPNLVTELLPSLDIFPETVAAPAPLEEHKGHRRERSHDLRNAAEGTAAQGVTRPVPPPRSSPTAVPGPSQQSSSSPQQQQQLQQSQRQPPQQQQQPKSCCVIS